MKNNLSVQERNEAILFFDGWKLCDWDDYYYASRHNGKNDVEFLNTYSDVSYHDSWNWLMPVCSKIENIKDEGYWIKILGEAGLYECMIDKIHNRKETHLYYCQSTSSKIEAVFLAVSDFCIEYNKTNRLNH